MIDPSASRWLGNFFIRVACLSVGVCVCINDWSREYKQYCWLAMHKHRQRAQRVSVCVGLYWEEWNRDGSPNIVASNRQIIARKSIWIMDEILMIGVLVRVLGQTDSVEHSSRRMFVIRGHRNQQKRKVNRKAGRLWMNVAMHVGCVCVYEGNSRSGLLEWT